MKTFVKILVLTTLLLAVSVASVGAAGPTGSYVSGISCVNLDSTAGEFIITFYDADGNEAAQLFDTIAASGSKIYYLPNANTPWDGAPLPSGFLGSAVVSSNTQLACSVNTQTASGTRRVGTSNGVASLNTSNKVFATQVLNLTSFKSYAAIQNAGNVAANVTVKYFNQSGSQVHTQTVNVPALSTHVFYQDDGTLTSGFFGSATFESSQPLAGTVVMHNTGVAANGSDAQLLAYNTFTAGSMKVFAPRVVKNLSFVAYTSGISCQNVGDASTTITGVYTMYDQNVKTTKTATMVSSSIAPGQTWALYMGNMGNAVLDGITAGYGSAVFTSSASPIACTFNEDNRTTYAGLGSTYSGIPDGEQTLTMFFPQIVALGSASYQGGFQIANTTTTDATCTYTYSNGDVISGQTLAGSGTNSIFAPNSLINNKTSFNGSVVVTCTQPIVGIYNLAAPSLGGDTFATNNGINK